jgi:hypothetical protein
MKTASGFNEGSGMIDYLRELAEAEPFVPFVIRAGRQDYKIEKREHITFTHYGSPKILAKSGGHKAYYDRPQWRAQWRVVNVDAISEIIL